MKQVFIIHGGDSFKTRKEYLKFLKDFKINLDRSRAGRKEWKAELHKKLGKKYEVFLPQMPNKSNARFEEWELWFDKFIPFMKDGMILIGHSLGGQFLAKYLDTKRFPKKIRAVFLIAPCFDYDSFAKIGDLKLFSDQTTKIFLYQSKDDSIVPFSDFEEYRLRLPNAVCRIFEDQWHFAGESIPGLVKDIKALA